MARNLVTIDEIVNDYVLTMGSDDFGADVSDTLVRNYALRGLRDLGFDILKVVKSIKLPVTTANNSVELPDDFVDLVKIGVVGSDGLLYVFGQNKNINASMQYVLDSSSQPIDSDNDGIYDRESAKVVPAPTSAERGYESYMFRNYLLETTYGALYGLGGGNYSGEYRMNSEQNRIELSTSDSIGYVVIEYIADEARSVNPSVHIYAENALRSYIYYRLIERKTSVPLGEKARARQEYYNERRLANSRLNAVSKEEILKTIRKNFKQSPKY